MSTGNTNQSSTGTTGPGPSNQPGQGVGKQASKLASAIRKVHKVQGGKRHLGHLGKQQAKRYGRPKKDPLEGITKPALRRLCRKAGIKRISGLTYEECRVILRNKMVKIIQDASVYTEHAKRRTIMAPDVVYALKRNNITLYGFDGVPAK